MTGSQKEVSLLVRQRRCRQRSNETRQGILEIARHIVVTRACVREFVQERSRKRLHAPEFRAVHDNAFGGRLP